MIRARDLTVRLGRRNILHNANFDIRTGERIAVLGLNGAGKTTLFRCLLGMTRYRGTLTVQEQEIRTAGPGARRQIGYVPQRPPKFDGTLHEMLALFTSLRDTRLAVVEGQLETMGLSLGEHGDKLVTNLSGGMIQKVLLVLAIASRPALLLLDEPTANLDPQARRDLLRTLDGVSSDTTILLSSHRLADVEAVARRVLVLHRGSFAYDDSVGDLGNRLGATAVLRLQVAVADQERTVACLTESGIHRDAINLNGSIEVTVDRQETADVVHRVRAQGIAITNLGIATSGLETELERLLKETPRD